jgi:dienelactone hydrolase
MTETWLDYVDGTLACNGWLVAGDGPAQNQPGVVLFPDARGMGEAAKDCARRLAMEGHVVLVADLYGHATFAPELPDAVRLMNELRADVPRWRRRAQSALEALTRQARIERGKVAAIGYCFGGSTALELALSGAALSAVVSFHGGLAIPGLEDAADIKARVLVCHGGADPLVPPEHVAAFVAAMGKSGVDWHFHSYAGVLHGFTNPEADNAGTPALGYNEAADRHSWQAMLKLFGQVFATK